MKILAIETSCDETAAAVVEDGTHILSNVVVSQVDIFAAYGGVIPEVAARSHLEAILPVVNQALRDASVTASDIDAIAVTHTPGLVGSLLIGTLTARTLAILWNKPLYAIHHLKSHIYANWLTPPETSHEQNRHSNHSNHSNLPTFPLLSLVISGGHTQIIYIPQHNNFEIIGTTRDDAIGECFDKVAKILGLPYPGGPSIAKCALNGDSQRYHLPHPKVSGLDFSFSGLKTAVLRTVQSVCNLPITTPSFELAKHLSDQQKSDFAASFQSTACDILLEKLQMAHQTHPEALSFVFAGGVSANQVLRDKALHGFLNALKRDFSVAPTTPSKHSSTKHNSNPSTTSTSPVIFFPEPRFTGDNAAMVGAAAFFEITAGISPTNPYTLSIAPRHDLQ